MHLSHPNTHRNNNNLSTQKLGKTINLQNTHKGLSDLISKNAKSQTFRSAKPRYTHNQDIFQKVPYTKISPTDPTRPSPCFVSLARDLQKQPIYCDQYDGPSSLITISPDRKKDIIKKEKMKNPYQEERDSFRRSRSSFDFKGLVHQSGLLPDIQRNSVALPKNTGLLKTSKQQYDEYMQEKQSLREFKDWKDTKNFINKRDRLMKNSWRHGVVGVENPLNPDSEVYNDIHHNKMLVEESKNFINNKRKKNLSKYNNTSSQINFGIDPQFSREDKKSVVGIDHQWKSKKISPERFKSTHDNLFVPHIPSKKEQMKARRLKVHI